MSLLTSHRRHLVSKSASTERYPSFLLPSLKDPKEVSVYVTNNVAGERAASFVRAYGTKVLEQSGVELDDPARVVRQTADLLPELGWEAALRADFKSPYKGEVNTGKKTPILHEPVYEPVYDPEDESTQKARVERHRTYKTLTGTPALMVIGALAMGVNDTGNHPKFSLFEVDRARDMLEAVQVEEGTERHFHYDLT